MNLISPFIGFRFFNLKIFDWKFSNAWFKFHKYWDSKFTNTCTVLYTIQSGEKPKASSSNTCHMAGREPIVRSYLTIKEWRMLPYTHKTNPQCIAQPALAKLHRKPSQKPERNSPQVKCSRLALSGDVDILVQCCSSLTCRFPLLSIHW